MTNADFYGTVIMPMDHGKPRRHQHTTKPIIPVLRLARAD